MHNTKQGDSFVESPAVAAKDAVTAAQKEGSAYSTSEGVAFETLNGSGVYIMTDNYGYLEAIPQENISFEEDDDDES